MILSEDQTFNTQALGRQLYLNDSKLKGDLPPHPKALTTCPFPEPGGRVAS